MQVILSPSSSIKEAEYVGNTLTLQFQSGQVYQYDNVPVGMVAGMSASPSAGQFFHRHLRNRFPYRKISE